MYISNLVFTRFSSMLSLAICDRPKFGSSSFSSALNNCSFSLLCCEFILALYSNDFTPLGPGLELWSLKFCFINLYFYNWLCCYILSTTFVVPFFEALKCKPLKDSGLNLGKYLVLFYSHIAYIYNVLALMLKHGCKIQPCRLHRNNFH